MFIPVTFACTISARAVGRAGDARAECLPMPYHPVSTCRGSRWPAATASSCASKRERSEVRAREDAPLSRVTRCVRGIDRCALVACHWRSCAWRPRRSSRPVALRAVRTCTISRSIPRSKPRRFSPTKARRGRRWRAPSRVASCGTIRPSIQAEVTTKMSPPSRSPSRRPSSRVDRSASTSTVRVPRPDRSRRRPRCPTGVHAAAPARCPASAGGPAGHFFDCHQRLRLDARIRRPDQVADRWAIAAYIRALRGLCRNAERCPARRARPLEGPVTALPLGQPGRPVDAQLAATSGSASLPARRRAVS